MLLVSSDLYRFDEFEVQPSRRLLLRGGERIALAPKTFEVLLCLVRGAGRVVPKEELLKAVWPTSFVEESNLTQHIFWLRKALADKSGYIVTISGRGYEFIGKVHCGAEGAPVLEAPPLPTPPPGVQSIVSFTMQQTIQRTEIVFEETAIHAPPLSLRRPAGWRFLFAVAAAGALAAGLGAWGWARWQHRRVPGDHHEVVLADFENSTGDASFDPALKTLLAIDLNQSPFLAVAADAQTKKALLLMKRPADEPVTAPIAREVCQRMNDQAVLSGMVARFGRKYLVTLTAAECADGSSLVQTKAVADGREQVLQAVDTVAAEMRERLGESLKTHASTGGPLPFVHTFSLDALRVYSQALALHAQGRRREAIPLYLRATELDPRFAAAYLNMAACYTSISEEKLAREAVTKAYELRDQGDDSLRLRIVETYTGMVTGDLQARLRNLVAWTQLYPNQAQPLIDMANLQGKLGHHDLAIEAARRAVALEPDNAYAYSALCGPLMAVGQVEEARATCMEAVRRKIDTPVIRFLLFSIAWLRHDEAGLREQLDWTKGRDEEGTFETYTLFAEGRTHRAVAVWLNLAERYRKQGLDERADRMVRVLLRREADYGMEDAIRRQLATMDTAKYPQNIVIAEAAIGRVADAQAGLKLLAAEPNTDTIAREYHNAQAVAAVALARNKPEEAIADLEVARPYDITSFEGVSMRGRAYLAAGQPRLAEAEFHKVTDHPFNDIGTQSTPLAHLGLARAYEMEGNHAASRREYETLFALWKDADADLPPLIAARAEYARIP